MPSTKYSWEGSPLRFVNGKTTMDGLSATGPDGSSSCSGPEKRYPTRDTVAIQSSHPGTEQINFRSAAIWTDRFASSTTAPGHATAINSALVTTLPRAATSACSTESARPPSESADPSRVTTPRLASSSNGPKRNRCGILRPILRFLRIFLNFLDGPTRPAGGKAGRWSVVNLAEKIVQAITVDLTRGRVVPGDASYESRQGSVYEPGISKETVGATAVFLGRVTLPPGRRTKAHVHQHHESAFLMLAGENIELWTGDRLQHCEHAKAGDYLFIPANVPHVAVNRSPSVPAEFVGVRNEPTAQESVVMRPELDALVP